MDFEKKTYLLTRQKSLVHNIRCSSSKISNSNPVESKTLSGSKESNVHGCPKFTTLFLNGLVIVHQAHNVSQLILEAIPCSISSPCARKSPRSFHFQIDSGCTSRACLLTTSTVSWRGKRAQFRPGRVSFEGFRR